MVITAPFRRCPRSCYSVLRWLQSVQRVLQKHRISHIDPIQLFPYVNCSIFENGNLPFDDRYVPGVLTKMKLGTLLKDTWQLCV